MIELAVDLGWNANDTFGKAGDVVVAKLANAIWSTTEQQRLIVVQRNDPAIEAQLVQLKQTDSLAYISYPYLLTDGDGFTIQESGWRLDFTQLPANILAILLDPKATKPIIVTPEAWWQKVIPPNTNPLNTILQTIFLGNVKA